MRLIYFIIKILALPKKAQNQTQIKIKSSYIPDDYKPINNGR